MNVIAQTTLMTREAVADNGVREMPSLMTSRADPCPLTTKSPIRRKVF